MTKKSRSNKFPDLMAMHKEWTDHMYNEGYWINRISWANIGMWRLTRSNNRWVGGIGMGCTAILLAVMTIGHLPMLTYMLADTGNFLTVWQQAGIVLGILGWANMGVLILIFLGSLALFLLPPVHSNKKTARKREL